MSIYEVIVGNIGTVHVGNNPVDARSVYGAYKRKSLANDGRAAGESVVLLKDYEIDIEYQPWESE